MKKSVLAKELTQHLKRESLSQGEFGKSVLVSQPVISRILNEDWQRISPSILRVADVLDIQLTKEIDPRQSRRLMNALSKVWDGSRKSEIAIAKMIEGVGQLI